MPELDILINVKFDGQNFTAQIDEWTHDTFTSSDLLDTLIAVIEINEDGLNQLDELLRQQHEQPD